MIDIPGIFGRVSSEGQRYDHGRSNKAFVQGLLNVLADHCASSRYLSRYDGGYPQMNSSILIPIRVETARTLGSKYRLIRRHTAPHFRWTGFSMP
jgi:hypothetical protein